MPRASGDLWNAGNVVLIYTEIMLENDKTLSLLLFTVIFLNELVLELIKRPSYSLSVTHSYWNWHRSKAWIRFHICIL